MNSEFVGPTYLDGNRIVLPEKFRWHEAIDVRKRLHTATNIRGFKDVVLDFSLLKNVYPNGIVPVVAEVVRLQRLGIQFDVIPPSSEDLLSLFVRNGWLHFICPEKWELPKTEGYRSLPLSRFSTDEELNEIVSKVVEICLQQLVFAEGVPQAFEWVLNEISGNVLVHSNMSFGWIQVVTYKENHRLALIVCDSGVGIPGSMKKAFKFRDDREAIELAMRKGVTSNPAFGQGNGLAGALAIAQHSNGMFAITSHKGRVRVLDGKVEPTFHFPFYTGTCVEMQFPTDKEIDLPKALWGHDPVNHMELKFEDDKGDLVFDLREYASSFGNRITGERLRNLVVNLLKQNPGHAVKIQMTNVGIISSSFGDELFGKLFVELGPIDFSRSIKFQGINPICKSIIDMSIAQRVAQSSGYYQGGAS